MMITGSTKYVANGNDYYTWYKIFGDLSSNKRPLVVLHGGPGMSHEYMSWVKSSSIELYQAFWRRQLSWGFFQKNRVGKQVITSTYVDWKLTVIFRSPVVLYDQIGNGNSSHIQDEPESFWNIDLFMNELDNLLQHLHISTFDLLGHSWGGNSNFCFKSCKLLK